MGYKIKAPKSFKALREQSDGRKEARRQMGVLSRRMDGLRQSFESVEDLRAAKAVSEVTPQHSYYDLPSRSDQAGDAIVEAMNRARARDNERHKVNGYTLPKYMSQAYVDNLETNKAELEGKGEKGQRCNRTACQAPGAYWFNHSTRKYYCGTCADIINDDSTKFRDTYLESLGHPLLTIDPDFADKINERM